MTLPAMREADTASLPDSMKSIYEGEALFLAMREHLNTPGDTTIFPNSASVQRYYNALIHVFNETGAVRDSIIQEYSIRLLPEFLPGDLLVGINSAANWTTSWRNGSRLTGNSLIDNLMDRYSFQLESYSQVLNYVHLRSPLTFNVMAVGQKFEQVTGVLYAEPNGLIGDGNNITGESDREGIHLIYSVGYGDCPAGCTARHYWDVSIDYSGNVMFVRSYGAPAP